MKRSLLTLTGTILAVTGMMATPLTPEEALQRLQDSDNPFGPGSRANEQVHLRLTKKAKDGQPTLYVFDRGTTGFMILGADDISVPLLGYSDNGNFDPDNIPPALEGWLNGYQEQLEYARENGLAVSDEAATRSVSLPQWSPIAPQLKTIWDQNAPFNYKCPKINNKNCPTGCVATAMSQVMNYYQYPASGKGYIYYQFNAGTSQVPIMQTISMNLADQKFDWSNMLDSYLGTYTEDQADAVATLMAAAGASVQMSYGTSQSGAISGYIPGALINYFGYDPSAMFVSRSQKSYTEWCTLIYNNLKNVGPVIYDGDTAFMGGHSFVCDGYQGNGYFHFNWGWSGVSDGYYLLDALNPAALGTGGAEGGFNFRQDVVINIQKPKAGTQPAPEQVVLSGSLYGTNSPAYLSLGIRSSDYPGFRYYGSSSIVFDLGAKVTEAAKPNDNPQYFMAANKIFQGYPLDPGVVCYCDGSGNYPFPMIQLSKLNLKDNVKYKITTAYRPEGGEWQEATASQGCYNYFYITKTGDKEYNIENFDTMEFDCTKLELQSPLYENIAAQLNLELVNNNNQELTRGVILMLLDDNDRIMFYGDSFALTLAPGETYKLDWTSPLDKYSNTAAVPGQYYLALYDMDTATVYYKSAEPVLISAYPGDPTFTVSMAIDNETIQNGVYQVKNSQDLQVSTTVKVSKGIYSKELTIYIMEQRGQYLYSIYSYPLDIEVINAGESYTYKTNLNFNIAEVGKTYYLGAGVYNNNQINIISNPQIQFVALSNIAGIDSILTGNEDIMFVHDKNGGVLNILGGVNGISSVEAYYLNGVKAPLKVDIYGDNAQADLTTLNKGVLIVTALDKGGNRKSIKLVL